MTDLDVSDEAFADLVGARTMDEALEAALTLATQVLDADEAHVVAVEADELDVLASTNGGIRNGGAIPVAADLIAQLDLIGRSHVFDDVCDVRSVAEATTEPPSTDEPRSLLMAPIDGVGLLLATHTDPSAFDDADRHWAEQLAGFASRLVGQGFDGVDDDRLERVTAILSHDFTGPLTVVRGSLELAQETGDDEYFERANQAVDRIEQLVEGIERLASAEGDFHREQLVELRTVVEEVWPSVDHDGETLTVDSSRTIVADEHALAQLLTNLLANAVEHGGDHIVVGALADGFYVEDDGPGIDPDDREAVFEWGHSTGDGHKGIGLSIAGQIAATHGWTIEATEGTDGGARFEVLGVDG